MLDLYGKKIDSDELEFLRSYVRSISKEWISWSSHIEIERTLNSIVVNYPKLPYRTYADPADGCMTVEPTVG
jgi:hypothetical protein